MATSGGGLAYIPGEDPAAIQANKAYQDALERLNKALESRQNRMFDPTMLALAEGFLTPGRTGSFGEALGTAAGKMRAAEEQEGKTEMELAQAKLGLAERGIALEQQRQRERQYQQYFGGTGAAPGASSAVAGAPSEGVPRGAPSGGAAGQQPEARLSEAMGDTVTRGMVGLQVFPPTQNLVTSRSLLMQRYREGKMSLGDALAEAAKLENDRYVFRDNSVLDKLTGRMFFSPTGNTQKIMTSKGPMELPVDLIRLGSRELIEQYIKDLPSVAQLAGAEAGARAGAERGQSGQQMEVTLPRADGSYGSYKINVNDAFALGQLVSKHGINSPEVMRFASKFTGEGAPPSGVPSGAAAPPSPAPSGVPAAPSGVPSGAPSPAATPSRVPSESERAVTQAAAEQGAKTRAQQAAEREAKLGEINFSAVEQEAVANRISKIVDESGRFIGIFARPGIGPAVLGLIQESIRTGRGGVVEIPTLENAVRKVMPNVKRTDLANIEKAQADLSNLELLYRKTFLSGQGAVSNMEGQVVARLGGSTSSTPETLVHRMNLIRARSQFDRADITQFNQWKERNPSKSYFDWQTTPQYGQLLKSYEQKLNSIDETYSQQREAPRRPTWDPKKGKWEF